MNDRFLVSRRVVVAMCVVGSLALASAAVQDPTRGPNARQRAAVEGVDAASDARRRARSPGRVVEQQRDAIRTAEAVGRARTAHRRGGRRTETARGSALQERRCRPAGRRQSVPGGPRGSRELPQPEWRQPQLRLHGGEGVRQPHVAHRESTRWAPSCAHRRGAIEADAGRGQGSSGGGS